MCVCVCVCVCVCNEKKVGCTCLCPIRHLLNIPFLIALQREDGLCVAEKSSSINKENVTTRLKIVIFRIQYNIQRDE